MAQLQPRTEDYEEAYPQLGVIHEVEAQWKHHPVGSSPLDKDKETHHNDHHKPGLVEKVKNKVKKLKDKVKKHKKKNSNDNVGHDDHEEEDDEESSEEDDVEEAQLSPKLEKDVVEVAKVLTGLDTFGTRQILTTDTTVTESLDPEGRGDILQHEKTETVYNIRNTQDPQKDESFQISEERLQSIHNMDSFLAARDVSPSTNFPQEQNPGLGGKTYASLVKEWGDNALETTTSVEDHFTATPEKAEVVDSLSQRIKNTLKLEEDELDLRVNPPHSQRQNYTGLNKSTEEPSKFSSGIETMKGYDGSSGDLLAPSDLHGGNQAHVMLENKDPKEYESPIQYGEIRIPFHSKSSDSMKVNTDDNEEPQAILEPEEFGYQHDIGFNDTHNSYQSCLSPYASNVDHEAKKQQELDVEQHSTDNLPRNDQSLKNLNATRLPQEFKGDNDEDAKWEDAGERLGMNAQIPKDEYPKDLKPDVEGLDIDNSPSIHNVETRVGQVDYTEEPQLPQSDEYPKDLKPDVDGLDIDGSPSIHKVETRVEQVDYTEEPQFEHPGVEQVDYTEEPQFEHPGVDLLQSLDRDKKGIGMKSDNSGIEESPYPESETGELDLEFDGIKDEHHALKMATIVDRESEAIGDARDLLSDDNVSHDFISVETNDGGEGYKDKLFAAKDKIVSKLGFGGQKQEGELPKEKEMEFSNEENQGLYQKIVGAVGQGAVTVKDAVSHGAETVKDVVSHGAETVKETVMGTPTADSDEEKELGAL